MITSHGIGSGLDVNTIVEQLMAIERKPLESLQAKEHTYQTQLSAYGKLKSAVSDFESSMFDLSLFSKFEIYKVNSSDSTVATATASDQASAAEHTFTVTKLAKAHSIASAGFADSSTSIQGTGTIRIQMNSENFDINIDTSNDTLLGVQNSINSASDNIGVKASLLTVDDGSGGNETRLVLRADKTGLANTISVVKVSGNAKNKLNIDTDITVPQDAELTIDGFNVTRSANTVDDVIEGVTFTLLKDGGAQTNLSVIRDIEAVTASVQKFVDNYNNLVTTINSLKQGDLASDSTIVRMKSELTSGLMHIASGVGIYDILPELGVSTTSLEGKASDKLTLDSTELEAALAKDFHGVAALFADNSVGIAVNFKSIANGFLITDGVIDSRTKGLKASINSLGKQIHDKESQLEMVEKQYLDQFTHLDSVMSQFQATNDYLAQNLSSLPKPGSQQK